MTTIARPASDVAALRRLLDGEHAEMRDRVREWLSRPGNVAAADRPLDEYRDQVLAWAKELADEGQTATGFPVEYGGEGAVGRSIAAFETMAFGDLSLLVKVGVQFGLFGGAVLHLGTKRHHDKYLREVGLRSSMAVTLSIDETSDRLPPAVEEEVLRIVQEAVTNARKHAEASNVWVTCRVHAPSVELIVDDVEPRTGLRFWAFRLRSRS